MLGTATPVLARKNSALALEGVGVGGNLVHSYLSIHSISLHISSPLLFPLLTTYHNTEHMIIPVNYVSGYSGYPV